MARKIDAVQKQTNKEIFHRKTAIQKIDQTSILIKRMQKLLDDARKNVDKVNDKEASEKIGKITDQMYEIIDELGFIF